MEQTRNCSTAFPDLPSCGSLPQGYTFPSPQAALNHLKTKLGNPDLSLRSPAPTTGGPCPGLGTHYGVRHGRDHVASIVCCPCCMDTPQGPVVATRCRIV